MILKLFLLLSMATLGSRVGGRLTQRKTKSEEGSNFFCLDVLDLYVTNAQVKLFISWEYPVYVAKP